MRPVTVQASAPVVVQVLPDGEEVTMYRVIGLPSVLGAVQLTRALALPATAVGLPG